MIKPPVLTIFAGPNGSGKSTLYRKISGLGFDLGNYINADDIVAQLISSILGSGLSVVDQKKLELQAFHEAERLRQIALTQRSDFSFETVFSHPSKLNFIARARKCGFWTRLYFVSTENSELNVARVRNRVSEGGHDVPEEKIISRYARTMSHLVPACIQVDEAYLFDNTSAEMKLSASIRWLPDGHPQLKFIDPMPAWVAGWAVKMADRLKSIQGEPPSIE